MGWRLAKSLEVLRAQVNAAYPNRDKTSDGTIGDARHAKSASDHNPNKDSVVCALDLDHDPDNGFDGDKFLAAQLKNPHPNLKYIVWEGHIYSRKYGWKKRPSSGHYAHLHISVGVGSDGRSQPGTYDNTTKWSIKKEETMSVNALTKEEVIELHYAYFGSKPGSNYDYRHVGGPLQALIHDWRGNPQALKNGGDVSVDCQSKIDAIYTKVKTAFGK